MNINVLDRYFEKIAVIDDYISLMWCARYNEIGAIDLEIDANVDTLRIFEKNNYITRDDDDAIYRIESIEISTDDSGNDVLLVGAYDMVAMLNQRITWKKVSSGRSTIEEFIRDMLQANFINPEIEERKIDNFLVNIPSLTTDRRNRQSTYDIIGEKILELCVDNQLGCRIKFDKETKQFIFELYKGSDRSKNQNKNIQIVFSPEMENLFSTKYTNDISEEKNVALIGGEGEDEDRYLTNVGSSSGLDRREMFVNSSAKNESGDLVEYFRTLQAEGSEKLSETQGNESFEGEIDSTGYKYKRDYFLGDIVTIENQFGMSSDARIVEIIETWNNEGYSIDPKFEYIEETIDFTNVILTELREIMLTENNEPLMYEVQPFISEDGKSYIITEDNKLIECEGE